MLLLSVVLLPISLGELYIQSSGKGVARIQLHHVVVWAVASLAIQMSMLGQLLGPWRC